MALFKRHPLLTHDELTKIAGAIAAAERNTSGQIRVSIRKRRAWNERKLSLHAFALKNFHELGMEKTKEKSGVLLFFSLGERAFQIIADEGIHKRVHERYWDDLAVTLTSHFKKQKFCDGICEVVKEIGTKLAEEFPRHSGDTNELPNDVSIR
ncbi:MAG TPA: TPM domain-containing protein [Bacteroidota bacterium]|nr:TPM domain-containing protein [Bacteroidota bacterium]